MAIQVENLLCKEILNVQSFNSMPCFSIRISKICNANGQLILNGQNDKQKFNVFSFKVNFQWFHKLAASTLKGWLRAEPETRILAKTMPNRIKPNNKGRQVMRPELDRRLLFLTDISFKVYAQLSLEV